MAPKTKQALRRARAKANAVAKLLGAGTNRPSNDDRSNEPQCDVPHCDGSPLRLLPHCKHIMCGKCVYQSIVFKPSKGGAWFVVMCANCRWPYNVDSQLVKELMCDFEPLHCREIMCYSRVDCGALYRLTHGPCSHGHYDCPGSKLTIARVSSHSDPLRSRYGRGAAIGERGPVHSRAPAPSSSHSEYEPTFIIGGSSSSTDEPSTEKPNVQIGDQVQDVSDSGHDDRSVSAFAQPYALPEAPTESEAGLIVVESIRARVPPLTLPIPCAEQEPCEEPEPNAGVDSTTVTKTKSSSARKSNRNRDRSRHAKRQPESEP